MKATTNFEVKNEENAIHVTNHQVTGKPAETDNQKGENLSNTERFNRADNKGIVFEAVVGF
jgi:hypothetical protein